MKSGKSVEQRAMCYEFRFIGTSDRMTKGKGRCKRWLVNFEDARNSNEITDLESCGTPNEEWRMNQYKR